MMNETPAEISEIDEEKKVVKKVRFVEESSVSESLNWDAKLQEKDNVIKDLQSQITNISNQDQKIKGLLETQKNQNDQIAKLNDDNKVSAYRVEKLKELAIELEDKIKQKKEDILKLKRIARKAKSRGRHEKHAEREEDCELCKKEKLIEGAVHVKQQYEELQQKLEDQNTVKESM